MGGLSKRNDAKPIQSSQVQDKKCTHRAHQSKLDQKLSSINSSILLEEFTLLYMALPSVHLIDHKDLIHWKWTTMVSMDRFLN
jgi:hypothetical protein